MATKDPKKFYNEIMPEKFGDDYEHERWFKNPIQMAGYGLTRAAIRRHILADESLLPKNILELGPGAGTWTKLLVERFPKASFTLLDISREMLLRASKALPHDAQIRTIESDILAWIPDETYDLFFSSRVLEYIDDKNAFAKKIFELMKPGSRGFLITKMPHYERERFLGRTTSQFHQGQIAPSALRDTLLSAGFIDVDCYPVTLSVPFFHSPHLNRWLGNFLGPWKLGLFGMFFAESYCVLFRKSK